MKLLREPLLHFLLLGAALFGVFAVIGKWTAEPSRPEPSRIVISPGLIENLRESYRRGSQALPSDAELNALLEDYVREEILCREARALELDRDDPAVRRQLRKRMEEFHGNAVAAQTPTEEQLQSFFQKHTDLFRDEQGRLPEWSDALRGEVQQEWQAAQRKQARDAAYQQLRAKYMIDMPKSPLPLPKKQP